MADQVKSEMFMKFIKADDWQGGGPVFAECAADRNDDDGFMKDDFNPQDLDTYSDFFEVTKFKFGADVKPEDETKSGPQGGGAGHPLGRGMLQQQGLKGQKDAKGKDAWQSWRAAATDSDVDNLKYPFEPDKFSFERLIDRASITLFEACCGSQTFKQVIFVKRTAAGNPNATSNRDRAGWAFLRIDFRQVMVTSLNWDDGDMLNEQCEFICRGFRIQYKPQNPDGSLLEAVSAESLYTIDMNGKATGYK